MNSKDHTLNSDLTAESPSTAIIVQPGWTSLLQGRSSLEVGDAARSALDAPAEDGAVLLLPTSVDALGEAAALVRLCGFEWRATLRGSNADGENLWLVGERGMVTRLAPEVMVRLGEGCLEGLDSVGKSIQLLFDGVRLLDLKDLESTNHVLGSGLVPLG